MSLEWVQNNLQSRCCLDHQAFRAVHMSPIGPIEESWKIIFIESCLGSHFIRFHKVQQRQNDRKNIPDRFGYRATSFDIPEHIKTSYACFEECLFFTAEPQRLRVRPRLCQFHVLNVLLQCPTVQLKQRTETK